MRMKKTIRHLTIEKLEEQLEDIFSIDETNLTQEYAQQASLYASAGVMLAKSERKLASAGAVKDEVYARADEGYRNDLNEEGVKYTEAVIKSLILQDAEYLEAVEAEVMAKWEYRTVRAVVDALSQRADMLISMGAHMRAEINMTGMNIKEAQLSNAVDSMKAAIKNRK